MQQLRCPLCAEEVYSGLGVGCKMCGMPLLEENKDFCSNRCKAKYKRINSGETNEKD